MTEDKINLYRYEEELYDKGLTLIAGVDEAGRGPIAGPLTVAACILPINSKIDGINDSKQLSKKKREELYKIIVKKAIAYKVVFISPKEIDETNIYTAVLKGMKKAILGLAIKPEHVLIDFMKIRDLDIESTSITHGDALSASIAAASILAKVERDNYMAKMDLKYPNYGFKHNVGYCTKMHMEALKELGPTPIHRKTFYPVSTFYSNVEQLELDLFNNQVNEDTNN